MDAQIIAVGSFVAGGACVGGVMWALNTISHLRARVAELERKQAQALPPSTWGESLRLDHRAQLASIATLSELALSDLLDATIRLSPEAARRAVEKHAPHLFEKEIK